MLAAFPNASAWLPFGAFARVFGASLLILLVSNHFGSSRSMILLIGISVAALFNVVISFLSLLDEDILAEYNYFMVGSLKGIHMDGLLVLGVLILFALGGALALSGRPGVLSMGDSAASALGIRVKQLRLVSLAFAAASSAAVVNFAGLLGFVGLIVPHIARAQVGQNPKKMLCASASLAPCSWCWLTFWAGHCLLLQNCRLAFS